jgi:dihydrolipoamide dehydrogenase
MYDVLIIGGGPGGYAAAIRTSQLGGKAALIESGELGGTCVNHGCIPSKIWLRAAYLYSMAQRSGQFGIDLTINGLNLKSIVERKTGVSADIRMGMKSLLANYGVDVIAAHATMKNAREVNVEGKTIQAKKIIVATGSSANIPDITGIKSAMTVDQLYGMAELPKSVLILGAGYNEVEAAYLLATFGSKVYLVTDDSRILPREDHDTSQRIAKALRPQGVEILTRYQLKSLSEKKKVHTVVLSGTDERCLDVDMVLVGSRKPNSKDLGLEKVGVTLNEDGGVKINGFLETSVECIYAIGDVTGGWMLSHAASSMAVTAAENAMGGKKEYPFHLISRGLWTSPQVGAVGLTEEEAEKKGFNVETGIFPYTINGIAMGQGMVEGSVKVVSDSEYGDILGVHIVGENATELIGEAAFAMGLECTVEELAYNTRLHPTYSEAIVDAARDAMNWALYLPKKAQRR